MRCYTCGADKAAGGFSNSQKRKPAGARRCAACAAEASKAAGNVNASAAAEATAAAQLRVDPAPTARRAPVPAAADASPPAQHRGPGVEMALVQALPGWVPPQPLGEALAMARSPGPTAGAAPVTPTRVAAGTRHDAAAGHGAPPYVRRAGSGLDAAVAEADALITGGGGARTRAHAAAPAPTRAAATATAHTAARICAWAACGKRLPDAPAERKRCARCKQALYCGSACQKKHWREGGHREACKEPPCCTICLDGGDDPLPIQCGCGCRGDADLAHVACRVEVAARRGDWCHDGWLECTPCGQDYTGAMRLGLTQELDRRMRRTRHRDDRDRLGAALNFSAALRDAGHYARAEGIQVEVLAARERLHGEDHKDTICAATNLAVTYSRQGRVAEAAELQVRALETSGRVKGPEDPDTVNAKGNLAAMYLTLGRVAAAEGLQAEVLAAHERVHGMEHAHTLVAANNLALTHGSQGNFAAAEELQDRVLAVNSRVKGADHPDTLNAAGNLVTTYRSQGRLAAAGQLEARVLEAKTRVQGGEHPDTLEYAACVALARRQHGGFAEAADLQVSVLATRRRVQGAQHADTHQVSPTATCTAAAAQTRVGDFAGGGVAGGPRLRACMRVLGSAHAWSPDACGRVPMIPKESASEPT